MNIISKKKNITFLITTLIALNLLACTNADNRNNTARQDFNRTQNALDNRGQENRNQGNIDENNLGQFDRDHNNRNEGAAELTRRADRIADELTKIKGVKSANVLISNERALVGIDIDRNLEGKATTNLKTEVENKVKRVDSKIKTVAVSSDADTLQRIGNIGEGINTGRPLSEFGNEIEELFRRILPQ